MKLKKVRLLYINSCLQNDRVIELVIAICLNFGMFWKFCCAKRT